MLYIVPEIAWAGISLAIFTGLLIPIIVETLPNETHTEQLKKSMQAMICLGIGEIVGSLAIGQVIDKVGNKVTSWITIVLIVLQTFLTVLYIYNGVYNWLIFAVTFIYGL